MVGRLARAELREFAGTVLDGVIGPVCVLRAFGIGDVLLVNEVVDRAGLPWLAREMAADPEFRVVEPPSPLRHGEWLRARSWRRM